MQQRIGELLTATIQDEKEKKLLSLMELLAARNAQLAELQKKHAATCTTLEGVQGDMAELQEEHTCSNSEMEALRAQVAALEKKLDDNKVNDTFIAAIAHERDNLRDVASEYELKIQKLAQEAAHYARQNVYLTEKVEEYTRKAEALQEKELRSRSDKQKLQLELNMDQRDVMEARKLLLQVQELQGSNAQLLKEKVIREGEMIIMSKEKVLLNEKMSALERGTKDQLCDLTNTMHSRVDESERLCKLAQLELVDAKQRFALDLADYGVLEDRYREVTGLLEQSETDRLLLKDKYLALGGQVEKLVEGEKLQAAEKERKYEAERQKWAGLLNESDQKIRKLVDGMTQMAAQLKANANTINSLRAEVASRSATVLIDL